MTIAKRRCHNAAGVGVREKAPSGSIAAPVNRYGRVEYAPLQCSFGADQYSC